MQRQLSSLRAGQSGTVRQVSLTGATRRRLQDLGVIPGTKIVCRQLSPAGDLAAYTVRGTVVALRRADAERIWVETR